MFRLFHLINKKLASPIGFIVLLIFSVAMAFLSAKTDGELGVVFFLLFFSIPLILLFLLKPDAGIIFLFVFSGLLFFLLKLVYVDIPMGVAIDLGLIIIFLGVLMQSPPGNIKKHFRSPAYVLLLIWFVYLTLEIANPSGNFGAWFYGYKSQLRHFLIFFICYVIFKDKSFFKWFVGFWFFLAIFGALYGCYQELIGIPDFDMKIAMSDEKFRALHWVGGRWRKWSIFQNSTDFGIFMAISSVFFIIITFGKMAFGKKVFFWISSMIMIIGAAYSGTRTAYAMIVIGFALYLLFEITNIKITLAMAFLFVVFLIIIYGPFYHPLINRVRSTFRPSEDASYMVRETNKNRIRPYMWSHPMGGGLSTTGRAGESNAPGHPLAGFPTDGHYVQVALETGWVGLTLILLLYGSVLISGVNTVNKVKGEDKLKLKALIIVFFMLVVAGYGQNNIYQIPYAFIFWGIMGYSASLTNHYASVEEERGK